MNKDALADYARRVAEKDVTWRDGFDERQQRLIVDCERYESGDPGGLPGHQLMLIVAKMAGLLDDG